MTRIIEHYQNQKTTACAALAAMLAFAICVSCVQAADIYVGNMKADKVLFLGNSLTHHPPKPEIGWTGDWGMDASSRDKDYAHLVADAIAGLNGGNSPAIQALNVYNFGMFEQNYGPDYDVETELQTLLAWQPDILVTEIGDNVSASLTTPEAQAAFAGSFAELLAAFKEAGTSEIFVLSTYWPNEITDGILQQACTDAGGVFVNIGDVYANPANRGGWGDHPNDAGMAAIADRVFGVMTAHNAPEPGALLLSTSGIMGIAAYLFKNRNR